MENLRNFDKPDHLNILQIEIVILDILVKGVRKIRNEFDPHLGVTNG